MRRKQLSIELARLAELTQIASGRLELIEIGQLDQADLAEHELSILASVLNCSSDFLSSGYDKVPAFQGYPVGNRSRGDRFQEELPLGPQSLFGPNTCPTCGEHVKGSRCDNGHFQE